MLGSANYWSNGFGHGNAKQPFSRMCVIPIQRYSPRIIPRGKCETIRKIQCPKTNCTYMITLCKGEPGEPRINCHDIRNTHGLRYGTGNFNDFPVRVTQGILNGNFAWAYIRRDMYLREYGESWRHTVRGKRENISASTKNVSHTGSIHDGEIGKLDDNRCAFGHFTHMLGHQSAFFDSTVGSGRYVNGLKAFGFAPIFRRGENEDGVVRHNFSTIRQKFSDQCRLVVVEEEGYVLTGEPTGFLKGITGGGESRHFIGFSPPCTVLPVVGDVHLSCIHVEPLHFCPRMSRMSSSDNPTSFVSIFFTNPGGTFCPSWKAKVNGG